VIPDVATELEAVIAAILRITKNKVSTFSVGGRQVAFEGVAMLEALYWRQQFLDAKIARAQKSNKGMRTRYGVVV
jgi:orotidine-5'-phosphate decarboxylase